MNIGGGMYVNILVVITFRFLSLCLSDILIY